MHPTLTSNRGHYSHSWGCLTSWPHSTYLWLSFDMFKSKRAVKMAEIFHGTYLKIDSKFFFWRKWYLISDHGVILDDPGQLELDTIIEKWGSLEGFSWVANLMAALAKLYIPNKTFLNAFQHCSNTFQHSLSIFYYFCNTFYTVATDCNIDETHLKYYWNTFQHFYNII